MNMFPPIVIVIGFSAAFFGLFFGLYALLTRDRRRSMREIRRAARERGWQFQLRHWQGNPTAFRIDSQTQGGMPWTMKSSGTSGYQRGWSATLVLRFPTLCGEMDFAVLPREAGDSGGKLVNGDVSPAVEARVANFSGVAAEAVAFLREAREVASGVVAFDAAYRISVLPQLQHSPIEPGLAKRIMDWPGGTIHPHSVLAWRDPFGLVFKARLPAPANWATASYLVTLGEELCKRVPASEVSRTPRTLVDRVIARVVR